MSRSCARPVNQPDRSRLPKIPGRASVPSMSSARGHLMRLSFVFSGRRRLRLAVPAMAMLALSLTGCAADAAPEDARLPLPSPITEDAAFADWLTAFRADALKAGIQPKTFDRSLAGIRIDRDVIEANEAQPEFTKPVWEYLEGALSDTRVAKGRALLAENKTLLDRIEASYGVDRHL